MPVYRHADYLAEAIEGVLAQQCDFEVELLIGEDCSPDASLQVARRYLRAAPGCIRIISADQNVGLNRNLRRLVAAARGEFLAFCEGDDYWCDPSKLADEVTILDADSTVGVVHSDWLIARPSSGGWQIRAGQSAHARVAPQYLSGDLFASFHHPKILRTCTRVARAALVRDALTVLGRREYRFADTLQAAYITAHARVGYLPRATAVYRHSPGSVLRSGIAARIAFLRSSLEFDADARRHFAHRPDYPEAYHWELAVGLMLWSLRAGDWAGVRDAAATLWRHHTLASHIRAFSLAVRMRCSGLLRRSTQG